uniref:F-box domain-containing protein n=1 Tax=Plectus sambesii TaxID=2011161 RepID=A0A914US74_9BILA
MGNQCLHRFCEEGQTTGVAKESGMLRRVMRRKRSCFMEELPNEVVLRILRHVLPGNGDYARLHLVCRRWHSLLCHFADILPKTTADKLIVELQRSKTKKPQLELALKSVDAIGCASLSRCEVESSTGRVWRMSPKRRPNDKVIKLSKVNGFGNGPSLFELLRHINYRPHLGFGADLPCDDDCLGWLASTAKMTTRLSLANWDMARVSSAGLTSYLRELAPVIEMLSFYGMRNCPADVVTDDAIEPIVRNGRLVKLDIATKTTERCGFPAITGRTLRNFAANWPADRFTIRLRRCAITAQDIADFVKTYQSTVPTDRFRSPVCDYNELVVDASLMSEAMRLCPPVSYTVRNVDTDKTYAVFLKSPSLDYPNDGLLVKFVKIHIC